MKEIIISENTKDQRLNKFLERLLCNAGSAFIYKMLRKKNITLNGKQAKGNELLQQGDVVRIYFSDDTYQKFTQAEESFSPETWPALPFERILYEDTNLLIFNKPSGMLSQRAGEKDLSVCEYLIGYLLKKKEIGTESLQEYRPSAVNRLDRNTSGIVLCAKKLPAAKQLSALLKERDLKKEYICLVKGKVAEEAHLTGFLWKDEATNKVKISRSKKAGSPIETTYTPLKFCDKLDGTVLSVDLITGKTHQIRAHLASEGYPVAGDTKYGDQEWNKQLEKEFGIRHQLLHAYRIVFPKMSGTLDYLSGREFVCDPPFQSVYED